MPRLTDQVRCKGVHVKLDRETHTNFKTKLVGHSVTMQEAFEEFARQLGAGNATANKIVERMIRRRAREEIQAAGQDPFQNKKPRYLGELDQDRLYDLISETVDDVEES